VKPVDVLEITIGVIITAIVIVCMCAMIWHF